MVYDAFLFFNELDLLELRLAILDPYVDFFVISEATLTFSGKDKPLYYLDNKERFKKYHHKIIHNVVDYTPSSFLDTTQFVLPDNGNLTKKELIRNKIFRNMMGYDNWDKREVHWGRDFYHRECVLMGLSECQDDDIILLSDLDEIPNPKILKQLKDKIPTNDFCHFIQKLYYYHLNCLIENVRWFGTKACYYSYIKNTDSNALRIHRSKGIQIEDGGWHFSFIGGPDKVKEKIEAWGHQELNTESIKNSVAQYVKNNRCLVGDCFKIIKVNIDDTYPEYLLKNIDVYKHLIKE